MTFAETIPVTIEPEASAHIHALGLDKEFDEMVEHTLQVVPSIQELKVSLTFDLDGIDDPRLQLLATKNAVDDPARDDTEWKWGAWVTSRFSPDVFRHFVLLTAYGTVT